MDESFCIDQLQYQISADPQTCRKLLEQTRWDLHQATRLYFSGSQLEFRTSPYSARITRLDEIPSSKGTPVLEPAFGTIIGNRCEEVYQELRDAQARRSAEAQEASPPPSSSASSLPSPLALQPELNGRLSIFKNGLLWGDHIFVAFSDPGHQLIIQQLRNGVSPPSWKIPAGVRLTLQISKHPTTEHVPVPYLTPPEEGPRLVASSTSACFVPAHSSQQLDSAHLDFPLGPQPVDPDAVKVVVILLSGERIKLSMKPPQTIGHLRYILLPFVSKPFDLTLVHPKTLLDNDAQTVSSASLGDSVVRLIPKS